MTIEGEAKVEQVPPAPPVHAGDARLRPLTRSYAQLHVPQSCLKGTGPAGEATRPPCTLGIDEAGRGPVLGPMVYAAAITPVARAEDLANLGFRDSKVLSEGERDALMERIMQEWGWIGWAVYVHSPQDISSGMLRRWVGCSLLFCLAGLVGASCAALVGVGKCR